MKGDQWTRSMDLVHEGFHVLYSPITTGFKNRRNEEWLYSGTVRLGG